jgi:ribonuclease HII
VDEAGRGPLAGPVYAAAVILDPERPIAEVADSKSLTEARRGRIALAIKARSHCWAVAHASVEEIDRINILRATLLAMRRAVEALTMVPHEVLIDGSHCPVLPLPMRAIVRGDATIPVIAAASVLAKTERDAEMRRLHERFPYYGFDRHKGYPTAAHIEALRRYGACEAHRRTFAPVCQIIRTG